MNEPRVFDYFDFVTLDAGERPLLALIEHLQNKRPVDRLVRTYTPDLGYVDSKEPEIAFSNSGTPTYSGLPLNDYLSLLDMLNPMHRLWVGWPLEQAHCCAGMLLAAMQLLRCDPRLHLAIRSWRPPMC